MRVKLIRVTTVPISLKVLLKGQLKFMSQNGFEMIGISSSGDELEEVNRDENISTIAVNMTRTISPFQDLISVWKLYKIFRKEKPTIVHTHTPKAGIVGMLAARLARVPIRLHTVAGMPLMEAVGFKRKVLDFVERMTYRCATKVYPNSKGLYEFIIKNSFTDQSKLKVIANGSSNGIDTAFFSREAMDKNYLENLKADLGILESDFVFIFVGRLVGDKGINELVASFDRLKSSKNKLLLVGPLESELDPLQPHTLQLIQSHPNIISVGFQKDVRPYFAISNALVFPSYREGFPNVVMQAGAMELPCIVSDINGCNEIIIDGENGIIVPVKNQQALYLAMTRLIENPELYKSLQSKSRGMITSRFEQKVLWEALFEEYKRLLKEKGLKDV